MGGRSSAAQESSLFLGARASARARLERGAHVRARLERPDGLTRRMTIPRGAVLALLAAALFGASTPLAKALLEEVDPWLLAGLLYASAGIGLALLQTARRAIGGGIAGNETPLRGRDWTWLLGAIAAGGLVAPVLLMTGL